MYVVNVDDTHFGSIFGHGTTDAIFILRQTRKNTLEKVVIEKA